MEDIRIEKNIPAPPPRPKFREFLDKLEVGESFRVPIDRWASLRNAAGNANRTTNKQYTVKKVKERPKKGERMQEFARVWRIS